MAIENYFNKNTTYLFIKFSRSFVLPYLFEMFKRRHLFEAIEHALLRISFVLEPRRSAKLLIE